MPFRLKQFAPVALTFGLLTAVWAMVPLPVVAVGAKEFHARSKLAVEALPLEIASGKPRGGTWVAKRVPLETRSAGLLLPNVERDLRYFNATTGKSAALSVIQVSDARTMAGHAPVNCYPGTGWTITSVEHKRFVFKDIELKPAVYHMYRQGIDGIKAMVVYDLFIFPDGHDGTSLEEIDHAAQDYRKMKYGIAHVQVVTSDSMTNKERDEIFSILVGSESCLQMVRVLRTGIPHEQ